MTLTVGELFALLDGKDASLPVVLPSFGNFDYADATGASVIEVEWHDTNYPLAEPRQRWCFVIEGAA